jgi:sec-independent protein translocase protein TatA
MGLKMSEILLIMAVLLLLFGASRLPQLGASLGSAIRNFKKGFTTDSDSEGSASEDAKKTASLASSSTVEKDVAANKAPSHHG